MNIFDKLQIKSIERMVIYNAQTGQVVHVIDNPQISSFHSEYEFEFNEKAYYGGFDLEKTEEKST